MFRLPPFQPAMQRGAPEVNQPSEVPPSSAPPAALRRRLIASEDWLAILLGGAILMISLAATFQGRASNFDDLQQQITEQKAELRTLATSQSEPDPELRKQLQANEKRLETLSSSLFRNPLKPWVAKVGSWESNPTSAFYNKGTFILPGLIGTLLITLIVFGVGSALNGVSVGSFIPAFVVVFVLATISYVLAGQVVIKNYNLEYALWALLIGMVISNTIGTPAFLSPAIRTELYIKTGLVLLGAEILMSRLLVLGLPGIFVSWVVTPITLISTYLFGQYVLRIPSRSLNMVISADMSVCLSLIHI